MLAVAVLVLQARIVIGGQTWDDVQFHVAVAPPRLAAADAIAGGGWPAWWDGTGFGVPLAAEPSHGAANPMMWIASSPRGLELVLIAQVWWLALGVAVWARRRGGIAASDVGALVAGLLVAAAGVTASAALRGALPALAQLPWIGAAASALGDAETRRARAALALALAVLVALAALGGELALLVDALALALVIGLRRARGTWRWLAGALAAGLAIGALQWLPAIFAIGDGAGARSHGLPLARLLELIVPGSFGSSDPDRAVAAIAGAHAWAPSLFVGAPLLALALARGGARRLAVLAAALGALALIAGRGSWPAWLGAPELHVAAIAAIAAPHAAAGLDALVAGERRAWLALAAAAGVTALALGAIGALRATHGELAGPLDRALVDGGLGVACLAGALAVARGGASAQRADSDPAVASRGWRTPLVLALIVAPSAGAGRSVAPTVSRAIVDREPEWARAAVQASSPPRRFYRPPQLGEAPGTLDDELATLAGTSAVRWGLAAARSDDPARPRAHDATWLAAAHAGNMLLDRFAISVAILPSSNVPHELELATRGTWSLAHEATTPPAAVYTDWEFARDDRAARARLFPAGGGLGGRDRVVLAGQGATNEEGVARVGPCAIARWDAGAIDLDCTAPAPAYAVVTSTPARGWSVTVDGRDTPWLTADVLRRAVALPPGAHRVAWRYEAPGLGAAWLVAALGAIGLLALAVLARPAARDR